MCACVNLNLEMPAQWHAMAQKVNRMGGSPLKSRSKDSPAAEGSMTGYLFLGTRVAPFWAGYPRLGPQDITINMPHLARCQRL